MIITTTTKIFWITFLKTVKVSEKTAVIKYYYLFGFIKYKIKFISIDDCKAKIQE